MKYQSTALGEVVEGDDPAHPEVDKREQILERALTAWGWTADIHRHEPLGRFVKFTVENQTPGTAYTLEVYIFPNLADSARNRPHEKRIQITRDYEEHQADFELDKAGSHRCLLLGFDLPPGRPSIITRVLGVDSGRFGLGKRAGRGAFR